MSAVHLRMSRLETESADYEEAEFLFPKFEARMQILRDKLRKMVSPGLESQKP